MSRLAPLQRSGFTLVELLVIISIVSLLISMWLTTLNGARKSAMQNACLNRHRSTITACLYYSNDYKQFLPRQPLPSNANSCGGLALTHGNWIDSTVNDSVNKFWTTLTRNDF